MSINGYRTGELLEQPNKILGGNLRWTSTPPKGSSNTPSRLHATETGQCGPVWLRAVLPIPYNKLQTHMD